MAAGIRSGWWRTVADPLRDAAQALCPESEMRAAMTDGEFWEHVLQPHGGPMEPDDPEPSEQWEIEERFADADPCPECGQQGPCAYDVDGRALIHVTEVDDG